MNDNDNEFKIISNHFFMQLKNLVTTKSNFKIQLNRVLQLAYNIGQLSIFLQKLIENKEDFKEEERIKLNEIHQIVMEHRLDVLDTYISIENQNKINKILKDIYFDFNDIIQQDGGNIHNFKEKYLKYKQKYLKLKKISK